MFNWNDIKNLDVKDIDLTKIDLTRFDIRKLELPKVEMPKVAFPKPDVPKFEMPKFDVPSVELPDFPVEVERVAGFARDAAYAGVGVAVITVQKLDEQRRELTDQVGNQVRKIVDAVA